jgi:hypothetical protein
VQVKGFGLFCATQIHDLDVLGAEAAKINGAQDNNAMKKGVPPIGGMFTPLKRARCLQIRLGLGSRIPTLPILGAALLAALFTAGMSAQPAGRVSDEIQIRRIAASKQFRDAAAPDALQYACAPGEQNLVAYFNKQRLPFRATLVRRERNRVCHILYRPTITGFRTLPDSVPLGSLFFDVEPMSLASLRKTQHGDSLDIAKTIVPRLPATVGVVLGVAGDLPRVHLDRALAFHFPTVPEAVRPKVFSFRQERQSTGNAWAQDYTKSGHVAGRPVRLVTRFAFEGRSENGHRFEPMLSALEDKETIRSKLSWEGGDLQFQADPRDPSRTLLFHGASARPYWGAALSPEEYAYVLQVEFGVDQAIDFSGVFPHVDYLFTVLPDSGIAIVVKPMRDNQTIAHHAAMVLLDAFGDRREIVELELTTRAESAPFGAGRSRLRSALSNARQRQRDWEPSVNAELFTQLTKYITQHCPTEPEACFRNEELRRLVDDNPQLLRAWLNSAMRVRAAEFLPNAMLSVIESQLPGASRAIDDRIQAKLEVLQNLGFRILRVPVIGGDFEAAQPWAGISYANAALVDRTLFVPAFGFGEAEQQVFDELQKAVGDGYSVVPVNARYALLQNGGIHCVLGFIRSPAVVLSQKPPTPGSTGTADPVARTD